MLHPTLSAIVFIAINATSPWAFAQNSYKCGGSNYSQTPCPDASPVASDDSRSNAQKKQTDAATARIARTADTMERERLAQEKKDLAANKGATLSPDRPVQPVEVAAKASAKKSKKTPEYFTAQVPGEKKLKKTTSKEKSEKAPKASKAKKESPRNS